MFAVLWWIRNNIGVFCKTWDVIVGILIMQFFCLKSKGQEKSRYRMMRSVKDCLRHFASSIEPNNGGQMCSFVIYVSSPVVNTDCDFFKCQLLIVRWRWILQTVAGNGMWALSKASFHTVSQNYLSLWSESRIPHHTVTAFLPSSQLVQPTSVQSFSWQLLSPVKIQQTEQNLSLVLLNILPNNIWPCWGPALQSLS